MQKNMGTQKMNLELSQTSFGQTGRSNMSQSKRTLALPGASTTSIAFKRGGKTSMDQHTSNSKINLLLDAKGDYIGTTRSKHDLQQENNYNPSIISKKEYLQNKAYKASNIINVKPEQLGIDRRVKESDFSVTNDFTKSHNVAKDSKAMRINRRQMFKNAPLEDSYEPVITTKKVN